MKHITALYSTSCLTKSFHIINDQITKGDQNVSYKYASQEHKSSLVDIKRLIELSDEAADSGGGLVIVRDKKNDDVEVVSRRLKELFDDSRTNWICVDFDKATVPYEDNTVDAVNYLIDNHLPKEFNNVDFLYQYSSSAGLFYNNQPIKEGTNVHIFFMMDKNISNEDLKVWLEEYTDKDAINPIDRSLYDGVHIINLTNNTIKDDVIVDTIDLRYDIVKQQHRKITVPNIDNIKIAAQNKRSVEIRNRPTVSSSDLKVGESELDYIKRKLMATVSLDYDENVRLCGAMVSSGYNVTDFIDVSSVVYGKRDSAFLTVMFDKMLNNVNPHKKATISALYDFIGERRTITDDDVVITQALKSFVARRDDVEESDLFYQSRWMAPLKIEDGINAHKSPKGSGKTERLIPEIKRFKSEGKSVIVIGHRVSLLASMSKRLGVESYKDIDWTVSKSHNYLAICADSVHKVSLQAQIKPYDIVIIDESEQVLQHLASTQGTISAAARASVIRPFFNIVKNAKSVVLMDADMSLLTIDSIASIREDDKYYGSINSYQVENQVCHIYPKKSILIEDILTDIEAKNNVFVCANSKNFVTYISEYLNDKKVKHILLTGDNSDLLASQQIISTLGTADRFDEVDEEYKVVLVSPTVGTGVDIQLPYDNVYGMFEGLVTTHYDMDQQLHRIRHPKKVGVWINPRTDDNPIDRISYRDMMLTSNKETRKLIDYNLDEINSDWFKWLQDVNCNVKAHRARSMNMVKNNFISMKEGQGWTIEHIEEDADENDIDWDEISKKNKAKVKILVQNAKDLDDRQYHKQLNNKVKTVNDKAEIVKYEINDFFKEDMDLLPEIYDWWVGDDKILLSNWERMTGDVEDIIEDDETSMVEKHIIDRKNHLLKNIMLFDGLKRLGVVNGQMNFVKDCGVFHKDDVRVAAFIEWSFDNHKKIKRLVGLKTNGAQSKTRPMSVVIDWLKKCGLSLKVDGKKRNNSCKTWYNIYVLDVDKKKWCEKYTEKREEYV